MQFINKIVFVRVLSGYAMRVMVIVVKMNQTSAIFI